MQNKNDNSAQSNKRILGLDLGTSSVGWCIIETNQGGRPTAIVDAGVRIFPEGVDRSRGEMSLNQERRLKRSLRRQTCRRVRRKQKLMHALQRARLLPKQADALHDLLRNSDGEMNPYALRALALDERLTPHQVGRALYQLGQRRGFKSNRKAGTDREDGAVADGIGSLRSDMEQRNSRTLGEHLNTLRIAGERIRNRYTSRAMYEAEFDQIWESQAPHHPKLMTSKARKQIRTAIFDQRPLKLQKNLVGHCQLETERKRAQAATLVAQDFRLWQTINTLKILYQDGTQAWLTDTQRERLGNKLSGQRSMTWTAAKKLIGIIEGDRFNLEEHRKSGLLGNQTAALIISAIGKAAWQELQQESWSSAKSPERLISNLLSIEIEETLHNRLAHCWEFNETQIEKLSKNALSLPKGYMHLSQKAMRHILPYLQQTGHEEARGLSYAEAAAAAGYHHSQPAKRNLHRLPFLGTPSLQVEHDEQSTLTARELRNPLVERALHQVRRVVNAIIDTYGKPDLIRVELARDLKLNSRQREDAIKRQRQNEKLNKNAEEHLREYGIATPSRTDIIKYKLYAECGHVCPYTGQTMNMDSLFGPHPQFDIEHIIPYTRCLDDSFMNKTLCHRDENHRKGNQTPWELYNTDESRYAEVLQRAKHLPYPKLKRFGMRQLADSADFVSQQLNETRYISRMAKTYLEQLGCPVQAVKGGTTATLRRAWGLNGLLDPSGEKTRLDHRHHAVDALVTAMTDVRAVQDITRHAQMTAGRLRIIDYAPPIADLRDRAQELIDRIIVSHKPLRKVSGPLHDDFLYGATVATNSDPIVKAVIRRKLSNLDKPAALQQIRDPKIRELALQHLENCSGDMKTAFQNASTPFGMHARDGRFIPIRSVRTLITRSIQPIGNSNSLRHVWTRSNHHMEIFAGPEMHGTRSYDWRIVSMLEAMNRLRLSQPVYDQQHENNMQYLMSLHINDMVSINWKGDTLTCRIQALSNGEIELRRHFDASKDKSDRIRIASTRALSSTTPTLLQTKTLGHAA